MKSKLSVILGLMVLFGISAAQAASLVDATALTAFGTDFGDTVEAIGTWLMGLVFVLGGVMFGVNMTKKALGKAGAR